jgi:hypothetical protein
VVLFQYLLCFRKLLSIVKLRGLRQARSPIPDRNRLLEELKRLGGKVLMTSLSHEISEVVRIANKMTYHYASSKILLYDRIGD